MTEEEKKEKIKRTLKEIEEIKKIKNVQEMFEDIPIKDIESQSITIYGTAILDVIEVLNLIDKQQKEIETLKLTNNYLDIANKDYISKDTIREKIKELNNKNINADGISAIFNITKIQTLEELLED